MSFTLNVGLDITLRTGNLTTTAVNAVDPRDVIDACRKVGIRVRRWQTQQSDTENTFVAECGWIGKEAAALLSEMLSQECVAVQNDRDLTGFLAGPKAAEWGDFNPEYFLPYNPAQG